jgi:hypothetical protein
MNPLLIMQGPSAIVRRRQLTCRGYWAIFFCQLLIKQFVGYWYKVPREHQTILGLTNSVLGMAMAGERVWQRDLRMRLCIGLLPRCISSNFCLEKGLCGPGAHVGHVHRVHR